MTQIVVIPPSSDPIDTADWVHQFSVRLSQLGTTVPVVGGTGGAVVAAALAAEQPAPLPVTFSAEVEAKLAQLTKKGKGKANAHLLRQLLTDLTTAGLALSPAPEGKDGKLGQPYIRVHRPANGKYDTAGYVHATYFAHRGSLGHVDPAVKNILVEGGSPSWTVLDRPDALAFITNACAAFLKAA